MRVPHVIDTVDALLLESFPVQIMLQVKGYQSDGCEMPVHVMQSREGNTITIQDLTERAMINRSTFYRHYLDKCALVNDYMEDVYDIISVEKMEHKFGEPPPGLINLIRHIQSYADFYRIMLGPNGDPGFSQHFRLNTERNFRLMFELQKNVDPNEPPPSLQSSQIAHAALGAVLWWLENGQPCPPEQLAIWMSRMSMSMVGPAIRQQLGETQPALG